MWFSRLFLPVLAAVLLLPLPAEAGEQILRHEYPSHPDTFVEVESVFGSAAGQGRLPFRITVRNHSGKTRTWTLTFTEGSYGRSLSARTVVQIEVESGREVVREVSVPFTPEFLAYSYRNLQIHVATTGLAGEDRQHGSQNSGSYPQLAISRALGTRSLSELDRLATQSNSGVNRFAVMFDPEDLPTDWISYTGLDAILLDHEAWNELSSGQRQALLSWVRVGGILDLFAKEENKVSPGRGRPDTPGQDRAHSLGRIRQWNWNGHELPGEIVQRYQKLPTRAGLLGEEFGHRWMLYQDFGGRESSPLIIFLLLVVFAILVAPVNLFYLAKPGRRHRLFLTTPVISVGTCLLIIVVIFFIDGIGGEGRRVVLADLQPGSGENRLYTLQEQISRTGVMVNSGFDPGRRYDLNPVDLPDSPYNPFSSGSDRHNSYSFGEGDYRGDFFRSRSEQGFLLRSVEPSRARVDATGEENGVPVLVSNLPEQVTALLYRDAKGRAWELEPGRTVSPGERFPLRPVEGSPVLEGSAWATAASHFSKTNREKVGKLWRETNRFFAQVKNPEVFALPTHPGLRWKETHLVLTGTPFHPAGPASPAGSSPSPAPAPAPPSHEL